MPRYRPGYSRSTVTSRTGAVSETSIVFSSSGGHSHDGSNSSLIDTMKYSIWDFPVNTVYSTTPRASRQTGHIEQFKSFVANIVNTSVLEPAGIVLGDNVINANNIVAGSISSELIAANTIVANNIAANTITTELLAADAIQSDNYSYTSGYFTNAGSFLNLSDGSIRTDSFYLDGAGNMYIAGDVVIGSTAASTIESGAAGGATSLQPGQAASDVNSNTTTISGGKIRTGEIQSTGFSWNGSSTYSTTGTRFDLDDGQIIGKQFRIDSSGNAYFAGDISAASGTFTGDLSGSNISGGTIDIGGSDATSFHVNSGGSMWLGSSAYASAPFRVSSSGALVATSATVSGTINASAGTFSGSITSSATITGGTVRTASSGERIVLSGTALNLYSPNSSSNTALIQFNPPSNLYYGRIQSSGSLRIGLIGSSDQIQLGYYSGGLQYGTYWSFGDSGFHDFRGRLRSYSGTYGQDWTNAQIRAEGDSSGAGMAIRAGNDTGTVQLRVGYNYKHLYLRTHDDQDWANLEVGNIYAQYVSMGSGQVGGSAISSSRTIKNSIEPFTERYSGLDLINQLQPVTYIRNDDETNSKRAGFIAEDMLDVFPEAAFYSDIDPKYEAGLFVDQAGVLSAAIQAIKELSAEVDSLKQQINDFSN